MGGLTKYCSNKNNLSFLKQLFEAKCFFELGSSLKKCNQKKQTIIFKNSKYIWKAFLQNWSFKFEVLGNERTHWGMVGLAVFSFQSNIF